MREGGHEHRRRGRDRRQFQRLTRGVGGLANRLEAGEGIAIQLEKTTEWRELRKLIMTGAAGELGLTREARNLPVHGRECRQERCRRDHPIAGDAGYEWRRVTKAA